MTVFQGDGFLLVMGAFYFHVICVYFCFIFVLVCMVIVGSSEIVYLAIFAVMENIESNPGLLVALW